ncbi:MAG TPA: tetratricopeptide repeat protein [Verrucomicrobiae bacterium]|jgi:Flp pilus assembly protein TadD
MIDAVSTSEESNKPWPIPAVCILLLILSLAVYGQTFRYGFVNYDDNDYVYDNPTVVSGLTQQGIASAFKPGESDNWIPLTTISHMLDCQVYGLNAGGHHLTNVLLHTASAILLFLVLWQMTKAVWRSAFVAAVFAVHPLHVESVAWVTERKDVLSGFFFMLTLWAYIRYVRLSSSFPRYLIVGFIFILGLMSKPMLVTSPFVLLLLDYWPLNRFSTSTVKRLIVEKIPLLGLSIVCGIITILAQGQAIQPLTAYPLSVRVENALVSCVTYLRQLFYPVGLAPYYPYPGNGQQVWKVIGALIVLIAISWGIFLQRRKRPYLLVGWLWYLVMLAPVIGLVQVGNQGLADRYAYLPQIGLCLLLAWFAAELSAAWQNRRVILGTLTSIIIILLAFSARLQASYWKNSETLWRHTLAVTTNNSYAHNNLGAALIHNGQVSESITQFQKALAINPGYVEARNNLGYALAQSGQGNEAIIEYRKALAMKPDYPEAHNNLGNALVQIGQVDEAIVEYQTALSDASNDPDPYCGLGNALFKKGEVDAAIVQYKKALAIKPAFAEACYDLGSALAQKGQVDEAITQFQNTLAINPNDAQACNNLGNCLLQKGKTDEAIIQYKRALAFQPGFVVAQNTLTRIAWVLATSPNPSLRNGTKAIDLAQETDRLAGGENPRMAATLAAAYAETGNFSEAITNIQRALQLASSQNDGAMIDLLKMQLKGYQAGSPFRDSSMVAGKKPSP